jgi:hypothetical protein
VIDALFAVANPYVSSSNAPPRDSPSIRRLLLIVFFPFLSSSISYYLFGLTSYLFFLCSLWKYITYNSSYFSRNGPHFPMAVLFCFVLPPLNFTPWKNLTSVRALPNILNIPNSCMSERAHSSCKGYNPT